VSDGNQPGWLLAKSKDTVDIVVLAEFLGCTKSYDCNQPSGASAPPSHGRFAGTMQLCAEQQTPARHALALEPHSTLQLWPPHRTPSRQLLALAQSMLQLNASQTTPRRHESGFSHVTVQLLPPHVTPPKQESFPSHTIVQVFALHATPPMQSFAPHETVQLFAVGGHSTRPPSHFPFLQSMFTQPGGEQGGEES
jgi:hypothetical protein